MDDSHDTTFLCCSSIKIHGDEKNQVLMYSKQYHDILCLGKDWRGKNIPQEAETVPVNKENYHHGVIRVLELKGKAIEETKWYATVEPYGNKPGYVELDLVEVNKALASRELVESTTYMRYDTCAKHPDRKFEACWYKFEQPKPVPSTNYSQYYDDVDSDGELKAAPSNFEVATPRKAFGGSKPGVKARKK
jgi:hypothetical protein